MVQGKAILVECAMSEEGNIIELATVETVYISDGMFCNLINPVHKNCKNGMFYEWKYLGIRAEQINTLTINY